MATQKGRCKKCGVEQYASILEINDGYCSKCWRAELTAPKCIYCHKKLSFSDDHIKRICSNCKTIPRCPKCGSTSIQVVNKKWSLLTGFATNAVQRVCANCGYKL